MVCGATLAHCHDMTSDWGSEDRVFDSRPWQFQPTSDSGLPQKVQKNVEKIFSHEKHLHDIVLLVAYLKKMQIKDFDIKGLKTCPEIVVIFQEKLTIRRNLKFCFICKK